MAITSQPKHQERKMVTRRGSSECICGIVSVVVPISVDGGIFSVVVPISVGNDAVSLEVIPCSDSDIAVVDSNVRMVLDGDAKMIFDVAATFTKLLKHYNLLNLRHLPKFNIYK